jgi:hypothetical protein
MFRNIIFSFILFTSLSFAQLFGPKISALQLSHDFGNIKQGDTVTFVFQLSNDGDDTLKIKDIRASCGCTAAVTDKKEILPGEKTDLKVTFNSTGKKGKQTKHIMVSSNDPKTPEFDLVINSVVLEPTTTKVPVLYFNESDHDFGVVKEGKLLTYTFDFFNKGEGVLEISNIMTSCGCTAAVVDNKILAPGEKGTLKVEFDSSAKSGKTNKTITVISNDPDHHVKILTISADINK